MLGLGRGTAGLTTGVLSGVTGSVAGVGAAVTKNVSLLSGDASYIAERERRRQRFDAGAGGAGAGVVAGGTEIARLVEGVGGIFTKPIEGAQEGGALGFFKGVGQGIVGAAVKPVVGVTDGVMTALQGVSNTLADAKARTPPRRRRRRLAPRERARRAAARARALPSPRPRSARRPRPPRAQRDDLRRAVLRPARRARARRQLSRVDLALRVKSSAFLIGGGASGEHSGERAPFADVVCSLRAIAIVLSAPWPPQKTRACLARAARAPPLLDDHRTCSSSALAQAFRFCGRAWPPIPPCICSCASQHGAARD